jgi:hypothetical protein
VRRETAAMRQRNKPKRRSAKAVLRLPDLDHSKSSVLQSLGSVASQRDIRVAVAMQKLESAKSDRMRAGDPEMANSPDSAAQNIIPMYELKWSHAEKTVARRAFDLALGKELEALLQEAKGQAARIEEPSELWDLERWLTERRREIDRRYDYRYSILPLVFAQLLRDGRLTEDDLHGLGQEKLDLIRRALAI